MVHSINKLIMGIGGQISPACGALTTNGKVYPT